MWKKFKELNLILKIIVGIIAIRFLPLTLLLLSVEFLVKNIKSRKVSGIVISGILVLTLASFSGSLYLPGSNDTNDTTEVALEESVESKSEDEKLKDEEEDNEEEDTDSKTDEENTTEVAKDTNKEDTTSNKINSTSSSTNSSNSYSKPSYSNSSSNSSYSGSTSSSSSSYTKPNYSSSGSSSSSSNSGGSTVYCNGGTSKSNKYHKSPTAHGMEGAIPMSVNAAKANGYVPCGSCYR